VKYFLDENKLSRITGSDWRKCDIIAVTYPLWSPTDSMLCQCTYKRNQSFLQQRCHLNWI